MTGPHRPHDFPVDFNLSSLAERCMANTGPPMSTYKARTLGNPRDIRQDSSDRQGQCCGDDLDAKHASMVAELPKGREC